jgi:hypothetical protein
MRPSSVEGPVATATPCPVPAATRVPACSRFCRSANGVEGATGSGRLSTGVDSPVSAASSVLSPCASSSRTSADTRSPSATANTSPGTSSSAGTSTQSPSRRTRAGSATSSDNAAIARPARNSCAKPINALRATTASTTTPSSTSPRASATAAEANRAYMSGLLTCRASSASADGPLATGSRLGPWRARRARASSPVSPSLPAPRLRSASVAG